MYLRQLHLINFKNYSDITLEFNPGVNCFTGMNGSGKTNLLDAIHYLSMTRSYFNPGDNQNIRHGEQMLFIQGEFDLNDVQETVQCSIRQGQKKQFRRNRQEYERLSDHIGSFPVVMIAPTDQELITEGSEIRRKFMDSIIAQYDHIYLDSLIRYNHVLQQRNSWLKQAAFSGFADWSSMAVWDDQLVHHAAIIHQARKDFIAGFRPLFHELFSFISGTLETAEIHYESQLLHQPFNEILHIARPKDLDFQYSTSGTHKDDLTFHIKGYPAKKYASQGQQKSFVVALKLAHFSFLTNKGFSKPIVLLDDIFDKLDEGRVRRLMEWVSRDGFGQLFITDTHHDRVSKIFQDIEIPIYLFTTDSDTVSIVQTPALS